MKKLFTCLLAAILAVSAIAFAENADWYELKDNVLSVTLKADADAGQKWIFERSDPETVFVASLENTGADFSASFTFAPSFESKVSFYRNTWDNMIVEVRSFSLKTDENGNVSIESVTEANADDDFGVYLNPYGYDLFLVTDLYCPDTSGMLAVEGAFGEMAPFMTDLGVHLIGFDTENPKSVILAEDCRFLVPASLDDPDTLVEVEDFNAWYEAASELLGFRYPFYAKFEMNTDGAFTDLEYFYIP